MKMKLSGVVVLLAASGASAYQQPSRNSLRSLGQKTISSNGPSRTVEASMKMEGKNAFDDGENALKIAML